MTHELYVAGRQPRRAAPYALDIDPERAGWGYSSLRVLELEPGGRTPSPPATASGSCCRSRRLHGADARRRDLRTAGPGERVQRSHATSPTCRATPMHRSPPARAAASPWQERSASDDSPPATAPRRRSPSSCAARGNCSRQVNNFAAADAFDCDKLIAVEVLTPGGNWSSYPPHKHDEHRPGEESELEEIYYFEIDRPGNGFGYQRVSPSRPGRHRRPRRGPHRRRRPDPRRLARPVHRRARPRHVLPERHGGSRARRASG